MTAALRPPAAPACADAAAWLGAGRPLVDVAPRGRATQSSTSRWSRPDDASGALGPHGREFGFHTDLEADPWWMLRLDRRYAPHFVIVHNRRGGLRERAAALIVEASLDGTDWTLLHRGRCHFGGDDDPEAGPPLILPLGGRLETQLLRLSLPGPAYLHVRQVQVLAEPGPATEPGHKVFLAARRDGFGERLRALMNAMILAERVGGAFGFAWEPSREADRAAHAILTKEETFAPDFLATHGVDIGKVRFRTFARIDGPNSLDAGVRFRVEQHPLATVLPELAAALPKDAGAAAFRRIRFSDRLESARRAAAELHLDPGAVALHLRAGDILYGRNRLVGHFAGKALAWPLAFGLAARLRAEGRTVVVFGQDAALCRHAAATHGGVFAGDVAADRGFDLHQTVLFEMALMARCAEIHAGGSGFAFAAAQIAGTALARPEDRLGAETVRALFLEALVADGRAEDRADAISDLQRAFAFWSAATVHTSLFDAEERRRFLAAAIAHDPHNSLYRLAYAGARLRAGASAEAEAALDALVADEAERKDGALRFVLTKRRSDGRPVAVRAFAPLAERDHAGALLCLALGPRSPVQARTSAARFLERRPTGLAAYDEDVRRILAGPVSPPASSP